MYPKIGSVTKRLCEPTDACLGYSTDSFDFLSDLLDGLMPCDDVVVLLAPLEMALRRGIQMPRSSKNALDLNLTNEGYVAVKKYGRRTDCKSQQPIAQDSEDQSFPCSAKSSMSSSIVHIA